jgi:hypothetical protein
MLIKQNWLFYHLKIVFFRLCTSSSINSEHTINVVVLSGVEMLLDGIAIVSDHLHETFVLVFVVRELSLESFCFFTDNLLSFFKLSGEVIDIFFHTNDIDLN